MEWPRSPTPGPTRIIGRRGGSSVFSWPGSPGGRGCAPGSTLTSAFPLPVHVQELWRDAMKANRLVVAAVFLAGVAVARNEARAQVQPGGDQRERLDYSRRDRLLEIRSQWFHLHRPDSDRELISIRDAALRVKYATLDKQRGRTGHKAAYDPAGAGSPWFADGPRNVNGRIKCL